MLLQVGGSCGVGVVAGGSTTTIDVTMEHGCVPGGRGRVAPW